MSARPNAVLAVVAGLVVVVAIAAAVLSATRPTPLADPSTPEGTVQRYVSAVLAGDDNTAVALLEPALGCAAPLSTEQWPRGASIAVVDARSAGTRATVILDITERRNGGLFDTSSYRQTFELVPGGPGWLITGEPWPIYACK